MKEELRELIFRFLEKRKKDFELEEVLEYVAKKSRDDEPVSEILLGEILEQSGFVFGDEDDFTHYRTRYGFFKGAQFRIVPLKEEIDLGVLVPGHRFIPFISGAILPLEAILSVNGKKLPTRKVKWVLEDLRKYFLFYGSYKMINYLVADDEVNSSVFVLPPSLGQKVNISVFDLKNFYRSTGFKPGNALMVTVKDWLTGELDIRKCTAEEEQVSLPVARKWMDEIAEALMDTIDVDGTEIHDAEEQLAVMYWMADDWVRVNPPMTFSAFFNQQREIRVQECGQRVLFWPADSNLSEDIYSDAAMEGLFGDHEDVDESELDYFLRMLGVSISQDEVEAYMRDALYAGENDSDAVLARVIQGRVLEFGDAEAQAAFHRLWKEVWEEVCQVYSRKMDTVAGPIRAAFLKINDQCLAFLRWLDAQGLMPHELPMHEMTELANLSGMISSAIMMMNDPDEADLQSSNELGMLLPQLEQAVEVICGRVVDQLDGASSKPKKAKAIKPKSCDEVYQLKIQLKGSKPPIWRRVVVPSTILLEDLHDVIQISMGWTNNHLHQFKQGNTFYQPDAEDDLFGFGRIEQIDSHGVALSELLCKEKQKIEYEYDFGDSWEHTITLEKSTPSDGKIVHPTCIKGLRACPPEDCGGIWGYYNMLEALADKKHPEHEEIVDWFGDEFEAEAFDLADVNARLAYRFK